MNVQSLTKYSVIRNPNDEQSLMIWGGIGIGFCCLLFQTFILMFHLGCSACDINFKKIEQPDS